MTYSTILTITQLQQSSLRILMSADLCIDVSGIEERAELSIPPSCFYRNRNNDSVIIRCAILSEHVVPILGGLGITIEEEDMILILAEGSSAIPEFP